MRNCLHCAQVNARGARLQCSHFLPEGVVGVDGRLPCVVYLHCNSGSRRDAEEALCVLIPLGVSVFTLDFEVKPLRELTLLGMPVYMLNLDLGRWGRVRRRRSERVYTSVYGFVQMQMFCTVALLG